MVEIYLNLISLFDFLLEFRSGFKPRIVQKFIAIVFFLEARVLLGEKEIGFGLILYE